MIVLGKILSSLHSSPFFRYVKRRKYKENVNKDASITITIQTKVLTVLYIRDVIITAIIAMMGMIGGVFAMISASIWFVTSEKVACVWNHAAARSVRKILSVAALTVVYCYVFDYSIFWTLVITIVSVLLLSLVMIASWVVRIAVVRSPFSLQRIKKKTYTHTLKQH